MNLYRDLRISYTDTFQLKRDTLIGSYMMVNLLDLNKKRIVLLIDHANVFHNLKELNLRIDWSLFRDVIVEESETRILVASVIYLGVSNSPTPAKLRFIESLKSIGYAVRFDILVADKNGNERQKGVDTMIYADASKFILQDSVNELILVSGDSDFVGLVEIYQDSEIPITIWSWRKALSMALIEVARPENVKFLDDIIDKIKLGNDLGGSFPFFIPIF